MIISSAYSTETFQRVQRIIMRQLDICTTQANPAARLRQDLGADALDLVELVMAIAREFGDEILDEDFQEIETLGELATYIDHKRITSNELMYA